MKSPSVLARKSDQLMSERMPDDRASGALVVCKSNMPLMVGRNVFFHTALLRDLWCGGPHLEGIRQ